MPIATTVNDGEVSLALPHAEPDDLEDNVLVIVNAQVIHMNKFEFLFHDDFPKFVT